MHHFSVVSVKLDVGDEILVFPDLGGRVRCHVDVATHQELAKQEDFRLVKANVLKNEILFKSLTFKIDELNVSLEF